MYCFVQLSCSGKHYNVPQFALTRTVILLNALHLDCPGEHLLAGGEFAIEMHIVSFVDSAQMPACTSTPNGCIAVTGIFFEIRDGETPAWRGGTWGAMCRVQGAGCGVRGAGYRAQGAGCRVQGAAPVAGPAQAA